MNDVTYTEGPRILEDGTNLDEDVVASLTKETNVDIAAPVTGLMGTGYQPGQLNLDGSEM